MLEDSDRLLTTIERRWQLRFDLREFHRAVLENGTVTLPMLQRIINHWIETQRAR